MAADIASWVRRPRVAIVAEGSRADGQAIARELAAGGCSVAVAYLHDQAEAEVVVEAILAAGGVAIAIRADLDDELDVERLFDETGAAFGGVDVLVRVADATEPSVVLREAAQRLRAGGAIVLVSSCGDRLDALIPQLEHDRGGRDVVVWGIVRPPGPGDHAPDVAMAVASLVGAGERRRAAG